MLNPRTGILGASIYEGDGPNCCNCNFAHNYPWAFGPRLGVAYKINTKTVLRAGFGIVYASTEQNNNATGGLASAAQKARGFGNPPYVGFPLTQRVALSLRPFPQFTTIPIAWDPLGKTWYDSLQVKVTKRLSHGFSAVGTYTWAKNLAMGGEREPNFGTTASGSVNDVFNRPNSKCISQYDPPAGSFGT